MTVKIVYYQAKDGNYGDELNKWLWPKLFADLIGGYCLHGAEFQEDNNKEKKLFYGIGTLLNTRIPSAPRKIIFGVGSGYGNPAIIDETYSVFFVRGPMTAKALNIDSTYALTDPAILLRNYFEPRHKHHAVSFMPHIDSITDGFWQNVCQKLNINYISPAGHDVVSISQAIGASQLLITEAMHGAIVADTLRVPWIPVSSHHINSFKWTDWCASLGLNYQPTRIVNFYASNKPYKKAINALKTQLALNALRNIIRHSKTQLSHDSVCAEKLKLIENNIDLFKSSMAKPS